MLAVYRVQRLVQVRSLLLQCLVLLLKVLQALLIDLVIFYDAQVDLALMVKFILLVL